MTIYSETLLKQNPSFTQEELKIEILAETRRRTQVYATLNHMISVISYFDFFSLDAFNVVKNSKLLTQSCNMKTVSSEFLLYPFLELESEVIPTEPTGFAKWFQPPSPGFPPIPYTSMVPILLESNLSRRKIFAKLPKTGSMYEEQPLIKKIFYRLPFSRSITSFYTWYFEEPLTVDCSIPFSHEVHMLFEKAAENAIYRFKTPVINADILFITLMEAKGSRAGKLIQHFIPDTLDWHVLRFRLLKRLHYQEINIRTQVPKSQQYFAYLLKTQLSELHFERLIDSSLLALGIEFFRSRLVERTLKIDLNKWLLIEINNSIKMTSTRKYSS
jgi:hypothetical protein